MVLNPTPPVGPTLRGGPAASRSAAATARSAATEPPIVVRETVCKTILNRTTLGGYSLNCYTGCQHACAYCYARFMQRFHPHAEAWGRFADVKINAVEVLKRQLRRAAPGEVFVSSACDGWQPIESQYRLTRRCCQLLLEHGFEVHVLTKSALVLNDLDVLAGRKVRIGVTLTTLDERLRRLWEPGAAPVEARCRVIQEARRAGLETSIMLAPLLPYLSDDDASLGAMLQRAGDLGVDVIWVDALNPRPRVWPAVAELLREQFPGLAGRYRQMLFEAAGRQQYLADLKQRIDRAAARRSLAGRVRSCL
jgi:DNA repair photolyase